MTKKMNVEIMINIFFPHDRAPNEKIVLQVTERSFYVVSVLFVRCTLKDYFKL